MHLRSLFFVALLAMSGLASAQLNDAPPEVRELELESVDGGFATQGSGLDTDAGVAAPILPPSLAAPSPAEYPKALVGTGVGGTVRLELLISERGTVDDVQVATSAHPELDAAALAAARGLRFTPASQSGVPLAVRIHFDYVFEAPPPPAPAQSLATVTGQVRARGTRRPVPGAVLLFEGVEAPVEADAQGRFSASLPAGQRWVRITAAGHKPGAFREALREAEALEVTYAIEPLEVNPYETVVRDQQDRTEVSRVSLREQEIREVPGTMGDPFRVVMLMPGVASVASGVSYPVVRGSQPAATGYFLDGVRVPMLFHLALGPAVIHPDFVDGIDFHPGVTPVRYGRLLGGAVEGVVSRPRDDRPHVSAYADVINAGAFVELPINETGTNVTLSGRYSYTPWMIALGSRLFIQPDSQGYRTKPVADFWDYQGRIEQEVGEGKLRLLAFGSSDRVGAEQENPDLIDGFLVSRFHRADLRYRRPVGVGEAEVGVTWGTENVALEGWLRDEPVGEYSLKSDSYNARASWSASLTDRVHLGVGVEVDHRRAVTFISGQEERVSRLGPQGSASAYRAPLTLATTAGVWTELQWRVTDELLLVPGARVDNYHLVPGINHLAFDPRVTARYQLDEAWTIKGGAALLHQPPTVMINLPVMDVAGLRHGLQEAVSVDVGAEWRGLEDFEFSADAYYTRLLRAVEFDLQSVLQDRRRRGISTRDPGVPGYAWGFELMARHPLGDRWFGWVSYSFQQSRRLMTFSRYDDDERTTETLTDWVPFAFEQTHVANVALSYRFPNNLTVGTVLHFNTGRPESGEISSRTKRVGLDADGKERWVTEDRDRVSHLPPFFRADLRVSYSRTFKDVVAEAYLDVMNVTASKEVLAYQYFQDFDWNDPSQPPPADTPLVLKKQSFEIPIIVPVIGAKLTY